MFTSVAHRVLRGRPKPDDIKPRLAMSWTVTTVHNVARLGEAGPRVWCMPCGFQYKHLDVLVSKNWMVELQEMGLGLKTPGGRARYF